MTPPRQEDTVVLETVSRMTSIDLSSSSHLPMDIPDVMVLSSDPTPAPVRSSSSSSSSSIRGQQEEQSSFLFQFIKMKGPPQIAFILILISIGFGSTTGIVPSIMSDRFARLNHGYDDRTRSSCGSYTSISDKPKACFEGTADAESAVALSNLISNGFTFLFSSLLGSLSDEYGRKGILVIGLILGSASPLLLVLIQLIPTMSPWWYYGFQASTGIVNWFAIALSALSDVLPAQYRAPGVGILLAASYLGFSLSPIFAFFLNPFWLSMISVTVIGIGLISTILFVPETLPPSVAQSTKERRHANTMREMEDLLEEQERFLASSSSSVSPSLSFCFRRWYYDYFLYYGRPIFRFLCRPFREMAILNRNTFLRLISTLAFFSGMVSSGDSIFVIYYLQEQLAFTTQDLSTLYLIMGILGLLVQGLLLKPVNDLLGEKWVVALAFLVGAIDNVMIGLAKNKGTIYVAVALSSLTGMAFPTISAMKANNVAITEQGQIQGALYSLQALASGSGPVVLRFVYSQCKDSVFGPGSMFLFAGCLYMVAVVVACILPSDQAISRRDGNDIDDHNGDERGDDEGAGLMDYDELVSSSSSCDGGDDIRDDGDNSSLCGSVL